MHLTCSGQEIEAVVASDMTASQLRVEEGFPLLMITRTVHRSNDGMPVQYSQDLLRSDYARVQSRFNRDDTPVQVSGNAASNGDPGRMIAGSRKESQLTG
jgi:hypothetical protein